MPSRTQTPTTSTANTVSPIQRGRARKPSIGG
jgi:hypothetical protein